MPAIRKLIKGCIITGGSVEIDTAFSAEEFEFIIAVDGGIEAANKLHITPTHIIGDFDTVAPEEVEKLKEQGVTCVTLNPEKNQTDTEAALDLAIELGIRELWIYGATGTRMDHTLANIALFHKMYQKRIYGKIVNGNNLMYLVESGFYRLDREKQYGKYVSILPFTKRVTGISLKGFKYPLEDAVMKFGECPGWGISNEIVFPQAWISVETGTLLVMETKD
jgi:thiamine pyrophosphokinase